MVSRLNIKLIPLFFVALWLFDKAGEILGYLRNYALAEQIRHSNGDTTAIKGEGLTLVSINDLVLASGIASHLGLLVGLVFALLICRKRKWHWISPTLALLLVYLTVWFQTDKMGFVGQLLRMPGDKFNGIWYYLINGLVCILLGLLTFMFINSLKRSDDNQHITTRQQSA